MRVLLVEDDELLGLAVRDHLRLEGHAVDWCRLAGDADEHLRLAGYDMMLLDLALPDGTGMALLKAARSRGDRTPTIIVTARDQVTDRIEGLNGGADDYLVKPFDLAELGARMAAVTRRYAGDPSPVLRIGEVELLPAQRRASRGRAPVELTAREWAILDALLRRPGAIVPKSRLEGSLYPFGVEAQSNTVEAHVSRIRRKLGADLIQTARGIGYRLGRP